MKLTFVEPLPRGELIELEAGEVVDEVRFPDIANAFVEAGGVGAMVPFALEMLGHLGAVRERERVVEHEVDVVEEVERDRTVMRAGEPHGLAS